MAANYGSAQDLIEQLDREAMTSTMRRLEDEAKIREKYQKQEEARRLKAAETRAEFEATIATKSEEEQAKLREKFNKELNKELAAQEKKDLKAKLKEEKQAAEDRIKLEAKAAVENNKLLGATAAAAAKLQQAGAQSVNSAITMFSGVYSKMNARLQGTDKSAQNITQLLERNIAVSPYVKFQDVLNNVSSLVESGVAYNVEQRAFLMTISDKIATTFDASNGTLLKIIRLQQEDSTAARLGMEARLTAFLNTNYNDTSYLKDVFDVVSDSIASGIVQLGTAGGAEYEYQIQKWLGSLYSLGIDTSTLTNIANVINMLSTGDVQGIQSSGLQNLIVAAANSSGLGYGNLLQEGVNASNVSALMSGILSEWSRIAQTDNQVVRKAYTDLYGLTMSDLVAIRNITQDDLNTLLSDSLSYSGMQQETAKQLNQVASRMHVSELINNAYENAVGGIGRNIANNPFLMTTWLINDLIKSNTGGINIPHITAMGSGIGLEADLNSIIQLGLVGAGTLGQIGNVVSSIVNGGGLNLNAWGATNMNTHGQGLGSVVSGVSKTTGQTTFVGNSSGSDIESATLNAAYDKADENVVNNEQLDEAEKLNDTIIDSIDPNIQSMLRILESVYTGGALKVVVENYGLTF